MEPDEHEEYLLYKVTETENNEKPLQYRQRPASQSEAEKVKKWLINGASILCIYVIFTLHSSGIEFNAVTVVLTVISFIRLVYSFLTSIR